jgi:hypothetical protein
MEEDGQLAVKGVVDLAVADPDEVVESPAVEVVGPRPVVGGAREGRAAGRDGEGEESGAESEHRCPRGSMRAGGDSTTDRWNTIGPHQSLA